MLARTKWAQWGATIKQSSHRTRSGCSAMPEAYVLVGSNIDPEHNIPTALRMLAERVRVCAISTFYRTEPLGSPGAPPFLNGAVRIETDMEPRELKFGVLREIESALGRTRGPDRYAPRTIDLDIALHGSLIISEPDLEIPDPDIAARSFVAIPLAELAPELVLPGHEITLAEVASRLGKDDMTSLEDFTRTLRSELTSEQAEN